MADEPERTMRPAVEQSRPGWVLFEVIEGDRIVRRVAIPSTPLDIPRDDRLDRMMADPEAYFAEARQRAHALVERDLQRDRERRRAERRAWLRRLLLRR
jgi:hypothetical protein